MINLRFKRRTWSTPPQLSQRQTSAFHHQRAVSYSANSPYHHEVKSKKKSWESERDLRPVSMKSSKSSTSSHHLQIVRQGVSKSSSGRVSDRRAEEEQALSQNCCLELLFEIFINNIPYLDDKWRASRYLERCDILWNFWIATFSLFIFVVGATLVGLTLVGQRPVLDMASMYTEHQCYVSGGDIVQYSLEGYVDSHWVPLRTTVLDPKSPAMSNDSALIANVTGVSGGWTFLDRFPMPPVHGRITNVPDDESIFSNNVAMTEEIARTWKSDHVGRIFPCLVPTALKTVDEGHRVVEDCSPRGLYPFSWAIDDLLSKGTFKYDDVCLEDKDSSRVLVPNSQEREQEASHKSNYGSHFACSGRIVFINATFDAEVKPVSEGYYAMITAGICCLAFWPLLCIVGRVHAFCWSRRDERLTLELGKAQRSERMEWRRAMRNSAKNKNQLAVGIK